jgi:hypothetical protein
MDEIEVVKQIINEKHINSNGSCGICIPDIAFETSFSYEILNPILRKLYQEKYFVLKKGINGKLIFKSV